VTCRAAVAPLFPTDAEIARELFGEEKSAIEAWQILVAALERRGLPHKDPVTGRRYWPAVKAYLDRRAGLRDHDVPPTGDGQESFHDTPRPRPQNSSPF